MTFSIVASDGAGAFGMAISSSSQSVAARCVFLGCGVGGAASQNLTDPRLGTALILALREGLDADAALASVLAGAHGSEHRQLMVVDSAGRTASFSGSLSLDLHATASGLRCVAAGNLLADLVVPAEMVRVFEATEGELETRLLASLSAGLDAGGERGPVRSAGLAVVRSSGWAETDLRIDWHDDPIGELTSLLHRWLPERDGYVGRGLDPSTASLDDLTQH